MSARYQVLLGDYQVTGLLDELERTGSLALPGGLRLAEPLVRPREHDIRTELEGTRWYLFEDDGAGPELEGKRVIPVFRLQDGQWVLAERRIVP